MISTVAFSLLSPLVLLQSPSPVGIRNDLKLEDLYPDKSYLGRTASGMSWSKNNRYLAFLWNPYDAKGGDVWIYDSSTGTSKRLTSVDMMARFDRDTKKIAERYKKEAEEKAKREKMTEAERKKAEEEDKKKDDKTPKPDYGGISEFAWSNNSDQVLFTYKGDIYRIGVNESTPIRLTRTDEGESAIQWTKADDGIYYRRGEYVFRLKFASGTVEQLNPRLPNGATMQFFTISPDETKMAIGGDRSTKEERPVTYIVYRGRFAEARTTNRNVADDQFVDELSIYLYDLNDDVEKNPENDGKPWEVYKWPAGKEYGSWSISDQAWSADSKKYTFATWKRDKKELSVMVADVPSKKTESVYTESLPNGGHTLPTRAYPEWTKDGKILINMDKSGYMQLWEVDPSAKSARMITKGDFEIEPVKQTENGVIVTADVKERARTGLYRVTMPEGALMPLATRDGNYETPAVSEDGKKVAVIYRSWSNLPELQIVDESGREKAITDSHESKKFFGYQRIKPQLFSFRNRHGDTVHGYMYLPPDYKKGDKRPLWIYTYGGPLNSRGKDVKDGQFHSFNMFMAYKYGYITCTIDPRGMSGYGSRFEAANWESPGKAQVEDLSDGAKWFMKEYGCDPQKIGINGWSFGGFQTQMCMYTASDIFTLGIAGAGPTEWQNYNTWYTGGVIGFSREGKPEDLDKYSLTKLAKNLKNPLMLLHGVEDTNVLYQDTVKVYQSLLQAGKGPLVELVIDPTGGHGLGGDIKTKDRYLIYEGFLARRWGPYVAPKRR